MEKQNKQSEELGRLASVVVGLQEAIRSLNASIAQTSKEAAAVTNEAASVFTSQSRVADSLAGKLQGYSKEQLKIKGESKKLEKDLVKAANERVKLQSKIVFFEQKLATATGEESKILAKLITQYTDKVNLLDEATEHAGDLKDILEEIDKEVQFFDDMADLVKDVPILSKLFSDFGKAAKAAREADGNRFLAGAKVLTGSIAKAGSALGMTIAVKGLKLTNDQVTDLSRNLNISRDQAAALREEFSAPTLFAIQDLIEAQAAVNKELGSTGTISAESAESMALMVKRLGLSNEQAAKFQTLSATTGKTVKQITEELTGQVLGLNIANDTAVDYKQVMKDVADASAATVITTQKFPGGIAKAAFQARKFGLTLAQLESSAGGLLNFESSIEAELEAELLTGKQLNLERARTAALTGNTAVLAEELAKNFGSFAEYSEMNVLQQEALAKSMGLSREEASKMLLRRETLKSLDKTLLQDRFKELSLAQQVAVLEGKGLDRAEALKKLGKDEIDFQKSNMSNAEATANLTTQMQESMKAFKDPLNIIANIMSFFAGHAGTALIALTSLAALRFGNISKLGSVFKSIGKIFSKGGEKGGSNFAKASAKNLPDKQILSDFGGKTAMQEVKAAEKVGAKGMGKMAAKFTGKGLVKRIPILGSVLGIGFAIDRLIKGDLTGAGLETLSAAAGLLDLVAPGLGTVSSLGIDAGIAARDLSNSGTITPTANEEPELATGGIVTSPTRALIGEAGPEAVIPLNQLYAKLDELISVVKSGGHVYMDGNKVGHTLALSTYKSY
jgi:hypothetical protein